ncbi:MAG: hypothetical protein ACE5GT_07780 [Rhodospirillales bacterium]
MSAFSPDGGGPYMAYSAMMGLSRIVALGRGVPAVVAIAGLAGCAQDDVAMKTAIAGYVPDIAERTAAVDWSRAKTVNVTLSEFDFSPARLIFRKDVPYRLHLLNAGNRGHTFVSEGFFKAIAAAKLVSPKGEIGKPYLRSVAVPPGGEKEIYFVPVRTGVYPLECTVFLHAAFGMEGEIAIR